MFSPVYLWLIPLGFIIGTYGTLVGAGGGFLLMPVLLLLYPDQDPALLTSISLAVVFFNALSGSAAYARMKRIDYKSSLLFSMLAVPGAILGAYTTSFIPRRLFDTIFGILLIAASVFLFLHSDSEKKTKANLTPHSLSIEVIEKNGQVHRYSYNWIWGTGLSFFVGFASSLLGIGGGIIHVPLMTLLLNFPVHVATATSHFILSIMAFSGTMVHIASGVFHHGIRRTVFLSIGVLIGAQLGARLSNRIRSLWIIRSLALALGFVGVRILILAFH